MLLPGVSLHQNMLLYTKVSTTVSIFNLTLISTFQLWRPEERWYHYRNNYIAWKEEEEFLSLSREENRNKELEGRVGWSPKQEGPQVPSQGGGSRF